MKKCFALLLLGMVPMPLSAQAPSAAPREEMKKLEWMVGLWEGQSWFELAPGQRRTTTSRESVQSKVGGAVLLIEGFHKSKRPGLDGKEEEVVTHDALGLLLYDEKAKHYRFVTYTARQGYGEYEAKLLDDGWRWGMTTPTGSVRFTIRRTEKGEWSESGEASQDGKSWHQFFEMTLQRVK